MAEQEASSWREQREKTEYEEEEGEGENVDENWWQDDGQDYIDQDQDGGRDYVEGRRDYPDDDYIMRRGREYTEAPPSNDPRERSAHANHRGRDEQSACDDRNERRPRDVIEQRLANAVTVSGNGGSSAAIDRRYESLKKGSIVI